MKKHIIIIGIAGASASGKTLFAQNIVNELGSEQVTVMTEDNYYKSLAHLPFEKRTKSNRDQPNAFDHTLLCQHLEQLAAGQTVQSPIYDFSHYIRLKETKTIHHHKIIILEGILLLTDPKLRKKMDIKIFMDTPLDICLLRCLKRDTKERGRTMENILQKYEKTIRPMYLKFIEPSKYYADITIPHGGANRIAIDLIKAKVRELLRNI